MNIVHRNYPKHLAQNGDIIVPIGNQLIYTDGNTDNPGVSKVITFDTIYAGEINEATEVIYDFEKRKSQVQNAYNIIENYFGKEFIRETTNGNFDNSQRFDRRAERGKSKSDAYHRNFMQDRIRDAQKIIKNENSPRSKFARQVHIMINTNQKTDNKDLQLTQEELDAKNSNAYYQATMDWQRGGKNPDEAYKDRGFTKNAKGHWVFKQ